MKTIKLDVRHTQGDVDVERIALRLTDNDIKNIRAAQDVLDQHEDFLKIDVYAYDRAEYDDIWNPSVEVLNVFPSGNIYLYSQDKQGNSFETEPFGL